MPKVFTVDLYKTKMGVTGPNDGYLMAHDDDALHYREKSLMQGLLNRDDRSEEHTSELQSLMRSSYAVSCLNKQTQYIISNNTQQLTYTRTNIYKAHH